MKYAKLINGQIIFPQKQEVFEEKTYINPKDTDLISFGFKEFVETERPEEKKWYYLIPKYSETNTKIVQEWEYIKLENPDYKQFVVSKIREKYDIDDEIALINKDNFSEEYIAYRNYVQECKNFAKKEIEEYNNV